MQDTPMEGKEIICWKFTKIDQYVTIYNNIWWFLPISDQYVVTNWENLKDLKTTWEDIKYFKHQKLIHIKGFDDFKYNQINLKYQLKINTVENLMVALLSPRLLALYYAWSYALKAPGGWLVGCGLWEVRINFSPQIQTTLSNNQERPVIL